MIVSLPATRFSSEAPAAPTFRTATRAPNTIRSSTSFSSCRTRRSCSRARLQGRTGLDHRRGEGVQPPPADQLDRPVRRPDEQPQSAQSKTDGRGRAGQHAGRLAQEAIAQRGWAVSAQRGASARRPARRHLRRPARKIRAREARRHSGFAACAIRRPAGQRASTAGCCTSSPPRRAIASCSIARSASARPWRCRRPRMQALHRHAISRRPRRLEERRWATRSVARSTIAQTAALHLMQDLAQEQLRALVLRICRRTPAASLISMI